MLPKLGRTFADLGHVLVDLGRCRTTSGKVRPTLVDVGQVWSALAKLDNKMASFGQIWSTFANRWLAGTQVQPTSANLLLRVCQILAGFGPIRPSSAQRWSKPTTFGRFWAESWLPEQIFDHCWALDRYLFGNGAIQPDRGGQLSGTCGEKLSDNFRVALFSLAFSASPRTPP